MSQGGSRVQVDGLNELMAGLKGVATRDINHELRRNAKVIASRTLLPLVVDAVSRGAAPQSKVMAQTARVVSDRLPVVALGRVNPRFSTKWTRKGQSAVQSRARRGSMARGVVVGPLGGHKATDTAENFYRIPRDPSGGPLGAALRENGPILKAGRDAYLRAYLQVLRDHGADAKVLR